jgi:predicted amidohydrolase
MSRIIRVGAAQLGPIPRSEPRPVVVDRLVRLLRQAAEARCALVAFPELALTPFFPHWAIDDDEEFDSYWEREMPNPSVIRIFDAARRLGIGFTFGYAEREQRDGELAHYFNSALLVDAQGVAIGKYRKVHLPGHVDIRPDHPFQNLEKRYFEVGDLGFPVFDAFGGRVGMCICNDRRWPETYRLLGLKNVELIMLGYNTPLMNPDADQSPELRMFHNHLCMQAGAYQNSTWIVGVAKCGLEEGVDMMAGTCIISPSGVIVSETQTRGDELIWADCDLDIALSGKTTEFNFARNRRPECYAGLLSPRPD